MTPKQIIKLIKEARDMGLPEIRIGDIYVRFDKVSEAAQGVPELKAEDIVKPLGAFDDLTTEEQLFYATPYFDELQHQKALRMQQLKDGEVNG